MTAKYILQDNLTFPSWTWDELVLPEILPHALSNLRTVESSYVDIQVSALRAAPSCRFQTSAELNPNMTAWSWTNETDTYSLTVDVPHLSCTHNGPDENWTQQVFSGANIQSPYFGYSKQSLCYEQDPMAPSRTLRINSYIWGKLRNTSVESIMALTCKQYAETVDASVRLKLPGLEIAEDHPPVPDESSAKLVSDVYVPISEWWVMMMVAHTS